MDLIINQDAMGLGLYQAALAAIGVLVLLVLSWRALRAVLVRSRNKSRMTEREILAHAWPPMAWLAVLVIAGFFFSTMQAYGPRVAIPKTKLEVNAPVTGEEKIQNLAPKQLTDEQRLQQQRKLEEETEKRVDLKD